MKKILFSIWTCLLMVGETNMAQVAPAPGKTIIQTPFGPKAIEDAGSPARPARLEDIVPPAPPVAPPPAEPVPLPANPAAAAQPAAQAGDSPVAIHLDNADIYQVVRIIGDALGLNYIIDPTVKGNVNISTSSSLRKADLLPILETVLKINGATMVRNGNFYQIVPAGSAVRQPLEIEDQRLGQTANPAVTLLSPDDQIIIQIVRLKYVAAESMIRLLTPYLSEGASIGAHEAGNILLISERRSNLRKLVEIIDLFDTNVFEGQRVRMYVLSNNRAKDVVNDLGSVFAGYALSDKNSAIRFVPIERLNSILVVTPNVTVFPEVERWIQKLDQPALTGGTHNFVYKVKNSKAVAIQRSLAGLYGLGDSFAPQALPAAGLEQNPATAGSAPPPLSNGFPAQPLPGTLSAIRPPVLSNVRIIADETNNALVIQATPQEYEEIKRTIEQLDLLPRQVLIDAQVYEVLLDDSISFGLSATLQNRGTLSNPQTTASFAGSGDSPASLAVQTFAFVGRARELVGFLQATENRSRVKTLSAPSVLVSDNMTAQFQVGTEIPVPTSSSLTPVQSGGTNLFAQTITFRNTGVILQVKPQINDSGSVTLDIAQEISQAGANTVSAIVAPVIGKSALNSTVVIEDGQTIALGGFIRENQEYGRNRVPLIGRVPGLGVLFGNTRRAATRTELVILITPHVIRNTSDALSATEELKAKLKEIRSLIR